MTTYSGDPVVLAPGESFSLRVEAAPLPPPPPVPQPTHVLEARTYARPADLPAPNAGAWWRFLPGAVLTFPWTVPAGLRIEGGLWRLPRAAKTGYDGTLTIGGDGVTLDTVFEGGQMHVKASGRKGLTLRLHSRARAGAAVGLWGACDDVRIGGDIGPSLIPGPAVIIARANESQATGAQPQMHRLVIAELVSDAGTGGMGLELKQAPEALIDRVRLRGGSSLISLPESDGARVTRSYLDLRGMNAAWDYGMRGWGIEVPHAQGVIIGGDPQLGNSFIGDGPADGHDAVSANTDSDGLVVTWNRFEQLANVFDPGWTTPPVYSDNILIGVGHDVNPTFAGGYRAPVSLRNGPR